MLSDQSFVIDQFVSSSDYVPEIAIVLDFRTADGGCD